jgi:adenylate cyclase
MRTIADIDADMTIAMRQRDVDAMVALADECEQVDPAYARTRRHNILATAARLRGEYRESIELNLQALQIHEADSNLARIATTLGNIGNTYSDLGEFERSLEYKERALALFLELGLRDDAARIYVALGVTQRGLDMPEQALESYHRALAIYEASDPVDEANMAMALGNIGNIFSAIDDYTTALSYHHRALALFERVGDISEAARIHGCIGTVYAAAGNVEAAIERFRYALDIAIQLKDRNHQANWLENLGVQHWINGDLDGARAHFDQALNIDTQLERKSPNVNLILNIAVVMMEQGDVEGGIHLFESIDPGFVRTMNLRVFYETVHASCMIHDGDLDGARTALEAALTIATTHTLRTWELKIYKQLRDIALRRNDLAGYVENNNAWLKLNEELKGADASRRLALQEKKVEIEAERQERERERAVLYSTLPKHVADRVIRGEQVSDHIEEATVLFLDIVGFTAMSDRIPPGHVVHLLKAIFKACDNACAMYGLTKVKTIGDSYLAVAGVSEPQTDHAVRAAHAALEMLAQLAVLQIRMDPSLGDTSWTSDMGEISVRIGLHCGSIVAGVVGEDRLQYDVWGDTVNVASRMESTSEPGRVHVSEAFANNLNANQESRTKYPVSHSHEVSHSVSHEVPLVTRHLSLVTIERGEIEVKGKGRMITFWLEQG